MPILLSRTTALLSLAFVAVAAATDSMSTNLARNTAWRFRRPLTLSVASRGRNAAFSVTLPRPPSGRLPATAGPTGGTNPPSFAAAAIVANARTPRGILRGAAALRASAASSPLRSTDGGRRSSSAPSPPPASSAGVVPDVVTDGLNDAQTEAVLRPRRSVTRVIAGPGAGKTRVLTCRMAHLLLDASSSCSDDDGRPREGGAIGEEGILAVTFTKKAAMEMERRLTDLLSAAMSQREEQEEEDSPPSSDRGAHAISTGDDDDDDDGLVRFENADPDDPSGDDDGGASRRLLRRTTVGTFHSVCSKILRKFGGELGDLPSVRRAQGATGGASGATAEATGDDGRPASNRILVRTLDGSFSIMDQSDQLRLLKELLKERNIELKSATAASSSSRGGSNDIRPITVLNAMSTLNAIDATAMSSPGGAKTGEAYDDDDVSSKMSRKVRNIAEEVLQPFQRAKYSQNSVDFDDLILLARELLIFRPAAREALHRRWRHVLVDEFQDTSRVQLDLARLLTTDSLLAVGDGDQSIYSWRGASPGSMSDLEEAFDGRKHPWEGLLDVRDEGVSRYLARAGGGEAQTPSPLEVKSVYLMENYRSTTNIVKAAQRIISASDKTSAQDAIRRDMKPTRGAGPSPRVLACKDARAEASFVAKTVNSMVQSGDLSPSSTVALIYRTNAQSRLLEEACVASGLRYVVKGSSGTFYRRAEIQDCMSFLRIVHNPRDRSAWARAARAPSRGIGDASLAEFFRYCDAVAEEHLVTADAGDDQPTPMDVLMSLAPTNGDLSGMLVDPRDIMSTRSINRFVPFSSSLRSLRMKAEVQAVPDFLLSVVEDLGLKGHFDSISKTRDEYEDRLANVMELVGAAGRYGDDGPCASLGPGDGPTETPLGDFLEDVALVADLAPDESDAEGGGRVVANLMTIHSSKGMEFDAVFLVGNEDGTLPTQKAIGEGEGSIALAEERRLCYVAMTRAKTHLVLTWRREVSYFAGSAFRTRDAVRSRFLDVLVSKKGAESGGGGSAPRGNKASARKGTFNSGRALGSMTKRELHSEADRYLAAGSKSWDDRPVPSKNAGGNKTPARKGTFKSGQALGSTTKRELHSEANRYSAAGSKSWDDWEPTSRKKLISKVPSIEAKTPGGGVDRRQVMPSSRMENRAMRNDSDGRRAMPPSQNQNCPKRIDSNRSRPASPRTTQQSKRQTGPSPQTAARPNRATGRTPTSPDENTLSLIGELPPPMDSTMFYPVGSSVKHNMHGRGIVQIPPDADERFAEKMLVRVKFLEESTEWDLPMNGLMHTYE